MAMSGAGTSGDPWQVATYGDLKKVGRGYDATDDLTYAISDHYLQTADIDASPSASENGSGDPVVYAGWTPIGAWNNKWSGVYDGGGYAIDGLYLSAAGDLKGFIADIAAAGIVRDLALTNVDIESTDQRSVGGVAGRSVGSVSRVVVTGEVNGYNRLGGVVGEIASDGSVVDCWTNVSLPANATTGGVVGYNNGGTVSRCYAIGTTPEGVVGSSNDGSVADSFFDEDTTGTTTSDGGGTGKTTAEMQDIDTYTDTDTVGLTTAWDMVAEASHDGLQDTAVWFMPSADYPRLYFEYEATSGTDALTGSDLTGGTPTLDTPTIGQTHALTGSELTSSAPTLDTPTLGQVHALTGTEITSGTPLLDTPTLAEGADNLTSAGLTGAAPLLDTPTIGQTHGLTGTELTSGTPTLDSPTIGQVHALTGTALLGGTPTLDTPSLTAAADVDALISSDLTGGTPTLDAPTIGQVHSLTGVDILGGVSLDSPTLGQIHGLTGTEITGGAPTLGMPSLSDYLFIFSEHFTATSAMTTIKTGSSAMTTQYAATSAID